jgi:hypothetical protein
MLQPALDLPPIGLFSDFSSLGGKFGPVLSM